MQKMSRLSQESAYFYSMDLVLVLVWFDLVWILVFGFGGFFETFNKVNLNSRFVSLKSQENFPSYVGHIHSKQFFIYYIMSYYSFNHSFEICQCFSEALPPHIMAKHDTYYWISHLIWPRMLIKFSEITGKYSSVLE